MRFNCRKESLRGEQYRFSVVVKSNPTCTLMLSHQSAKQIQRPGSHSTVDQSARNADGLPSDCERARARDGLTTGCTRDRERKTTSFPAMKQSGKQFWPGSIIALIPCEEKTELSGRGFITYPQEGYKVKQQAYSIDCTTSIQWNNIQNPYT